MKGGVTADSMLLEARGIHKSFSGTQVLTELDIAIRGGESVAILGQSGSGKTTLLSILAGLEPPDRGQVLWDGQDLYALDQDALTGLRGRRMGIIFQEYHLVPSLTALENVSLPLEILGESGGWTGNNGKAEGSSEQRPDKKPEAVARELLDRVGLQARADHYPHQLSGGEQQRVAIARALASNPSVLFADEPTGSLDESTAGDVEDLIFSLLREQGLTAVLITHNRALAQRCDRVLNLHLGRFG